jgi:dipeptidyl aminopeptidase/acylaminoacyl peptidase
VIALLDSQGKNTRVLERTDTKAYDALGAPRPRVFKAKARDGVTDIYGVMHLPSNFDPTRKYPVVDFHYPGPQASYTPKQFRSGSFEQAQAELGFVVVEIDGIGTPGRSKKFNAYAYGNLGDAGGLADHIAALRQIAAAHPYLDLDRVGIYGGSAGGFAAARAMLMFPVFFKVR